MRYGQYCPVALAAEVLAERWTLLIVRELTIGSSRFSDIRRGLPGISATLLKQRLTMLEDAGIVERRGAPGSRPHGYVLTAAGLELKPLILTFGEWGQRWARDMDDLDLNPDFLLWSIHRSMHSDRLPPGTLVIEWNMTCPPARRHRGWFLCRDGNVEVCSQHPGFDVDLEVHTDLRTLTEVWRGLRPLKTEIGKGNIRLVGSSKLRRSFPAWLKLSAFAGVQRPKRTTASN